MEFLNNFSLSKDMGPRDIFNYVMYDNPVSKTVISSLVGKSAPNVPLAQVEIVTQTRALWKLAAENGPYVRLAGIVGASAVMLGAYGAHKTYPSDRAVELKAVYETANKFHFIHTLALLGVPLCRYPQVTGTLIILGTTLFSGTCYYRAFTGESKFQKLAPVGGTILIFAWLSMVL